jgi:hypothetical protein
MWVVKTKLIFYGAGQERLGATINRSNPHMGKIQRFRLRRRGFGSLRNWQFETNIPSRLRVRKPNRRRWRRNPPRKGWDWSLHILPLRRSGQNLARDARLLGTLETIRLINNRPGRAEGLDTKTAFHFDGSRFNKSARPCRGGFVNVGLCSRVGQKACTPWISSTHPLRGRSAPPLARIPNGIQNDAHLLVYKG